MRKLMVLAFFLFASPLLACGVETGTLQLQITLIKGESSRDSHSTRTVIAIAGQKLTHTKSYTGRLRGRAPEVKEFELTADDVKKIAQLIKTRNLLVTETVEKSGGPKGTYFWFDLRVQSDVDGSKGMINIRGPRSEPSFLEDPLYKTSVAFIEEIYEIIHRFDKELEYEPLIP